MYEGRKLERVSSNVVLEELGWEILADDSEAFTHSPFLTRWGPFFSLALKE